ncbi:hypothetical protein MMC08_005923 [Hypocenomyce scalaris]|nr:hypothetical protein [Hypocenomyce scalaris]
MGEPINSISLAVDKFKVVGCNMREIKKASKQALEHDLKKLLTIIAGEDPNQKTYLVHIYLICSHEAFFRTARNGKWREGLESLFRLPTDDPRIVGLYIQWLYTLELPAHAARDVQGDTYGLGEPRGNDPTLKNAVVNVFITHRKYAHDCYWLVYAHRRLSEDAPEGTALRRLVVDLFAFWSVPGSSFEEEKENLSKMACFEVTVAMLKARDGKLTAP